MLPLVLHAQIVRRKFRRSKGDKEKITREAKIEIDEAKNKLKETEIKYNKLEQLFKDQVKKLAKKLQATQNELRQSKKELKKCKGKKSKLGTGTTGTLGTTGTTGATGTTGTTGMDQLG